MTSSPFLLLALHLAAFISSSNGACQFPKEWEGAWFQSGFQSDLHINSTHIETKGECYERREEKYLVYDKNEDCYRCMVIHERHRSVLQYKETYCESKATLQETCNGIAGDAALYSMFRKYPEPNPVPCPFKSAPFTFSYSRGTGDCKDPPSKAESCTDDSRLVLKYQACPDVDSTESYVEELICLAAWKDGSTRYLIGKIQQGNRRGFSMSDEDQYRCFVYQRGQDKGRAVYNIAQSGDATCTGLQNAYEGSKTMKLMTVDNHHNRCKFPVWITEHHTWLSLDKKKIYKFSQKNATLKILDEDPKPNKVHQSFPQTFGFQEFGFESQDQRKQNSEMRVICHSILQSQDQRKVQIVAHITAGCDSGHVCMVFYKRDSGVIEIQQSDVYQENPDDACRNFNPNTPFTTLTTTSVSTASHPKKCPHVGRYSIINFIPNIHTRKKRQQMTIDKSNVPTKPECLSRQYEALAVGCNKEHEMEFKSACAELGVAAYTCHGSWQDNGTYYAIAARKSSDPKLYCLVYSLTNHPQQSLLEGALGRTAGPQYLRLSAITESCHRHIVPGVTGSWSFNFTSNGTCAESDDVNVSTIIVPTVFIIFWSFGALLYLS